MSVDLVREQIQKFLSTETPEVLAIKGAWGVGKTYNWNKCIEEFKDDCALKAYSYVSLFGINSIGEVKQTTFLNTIDTKRIGEAPNIKGYTKKIADLIKDTKIPYVSKYVGGIGGLINSVSQLAMSNTVICFDDLERHSKGITIKDFMGLVSYFKEQKGCKVVLLLNEDAGDETFEDYRKYKEKIVDRQLHFEPTAEQCFDTMVTEDFELRDLTRDCCVGLSIKNKRVIKKVESHVREFLELVEDFDEEIKRQVIHSTVVLSWCYYCHGADEDHIPEFDFVSQSGFRYSAEEETSRWTKEVTEEWNETLNSYGYQHSDEIDLAVASGIKQGFLDRDKLIPLCQHKQQEIDVRNSSASWDKAWNIFHGSFDANENEIAEALEAGMRDIAPTASCSQYSEGLRLLRTIDKEDQADKLMSFFVEQRKGTPEIFNVDSFENNPFGLKDEKFEERLRYEYQRHVQEPTVEEILDLRSGSNSYNQSEVEILNRLSKEDIIILFNSFKGDNLTHYIRAFLLLSGSSKELQAKVKQALEEIASASKLNAHRMGKFKI